MRRIEPTAAHRAFRDDMIDVLRKHGSTLSAMELLALSAHLTGQIIALQDQRKISPEAAMNIVAENIEKGNKEVIDGLAIPLGSS